MKEFVFKRPVGDSVTVVVHDDIKEMRIAHLNQFQLHLSQEADMGSTLADWDTRMEKLDAFLAAGKVEEARRERENQRYGTFFFLQGLNIKSRALCDVVAAVNSKETSTHTELALSELSMQLNEMLTGQELEEIVAHVKKKFAPN